ncbi:hypothetical protein [Methylobacterium nodulans]|uniref:Uncharacterized protein n=1 Tax=Methylobacterium nodulans (strain LMG 21967 / CNCM I-2342 / ORS 2060) TaxID=460265 RepID=B8IMI4_METNO|nr:hypothetical protein [Methylobacterium nodulans]ACL58370.1 conserved hypothetical protein [Methylobacterium nodulans ORS 2060]
MKNHTPKLTAFTVAVGSGDGAELRVYAVLAEGGPQALEVVISTVADGSTVELCGHLSDNLASRLKLSPGEVRPL